MLKEINPKEPRRDSEQRPEGSPQDPAHKAERHAPQGEKLRGAAVISPPSSGVTSVNPGAINMKP